MLLLARQYRFDVELEHQRDVCRRILDESKAVRLFHRRKHVLSQRHAVAQWATIHQWRIILSAVRVNKQFCQLIIHRTSHFAFSHFSCLSFLIYPKACFAIGPLRELVHHVVGAHEQQRRLEDLAVHLALSAERVRLVQYKVADARRCKTNDLGGKFDDELVVFCTFSSKLIEF